LQHYFDTAAFSAKGLSSNTIGNAGRNIVEGPAFADIDMSRMKQIAVSESGRFEIRVEAFNVANHANFAAPNGDLSQGNFGQITNTGGIPRIMQFACKYVF
jgi:hypothetical protein